VAVGRLTLVARAGAALRAVQNLDGEIVFTWRGPRVVDLAVDAEGKKLVVASQDKRLLVYRFGSDTEEAYARSLPCKFGVAAFRPLTRVWRILRLGSAGTCARAT